MEIKTHKEEMALTNQELISYYQELREFLINTPHTNLTKGSLTICPAIHGAVKGIVKKGCGYEINIHGAEKIKGLTAVYANTHQSKNDHFSFVGSNPNHTILLNSIVIPKVYKKLLALNGVVFVDKSSAESKQNSKLEMMRLLLQGKSITIFPESTWNLSPNKLHLPMHIGFVDMAKKTGRPIVPVVYFYDYDFSKYDKIERVTSVDVFYEDPIYISEEDSCKEALEKYQEIVATRKWQEMEKRGQFPRQTISNAEYVDFIGGNLTNLREAGVYLNIEDQGIFGSNQEHYLFQPLNAVDIDENGNLLPTEGSRMLLHDTKEPANVVFSKVKCYNLK